MNPAPPVTMMRLVRRSVLEEAGVVVMESANSQKDAGQKPGATPYSPGVLKAILSTLAWTGTLFAGVVLAAWALGRLVPDSLAWSQYLYWMAHPPALRPSLLVLSGGMGRGAPAMAGVPPRPVRRPAARAQYILLGLWACVLG